MNEQEIPEVGPTRPSEKHAFIQRFVGRWEGTNQMAEGPGHSTEPSRVVENVTSFGGLFAHVEGRTTMPDGGEMNFISAIGWDVTFEEYRGVWIADVSSHIWNYVGELSEDGNTLSLLCEGPNMDQRVEAKTAWYRDVHTFLSDDERTMESFGRHEGGEWVRFMKSTVRRVG